MSKFPYMRASIILCLSGIFGGLLEYVVDDYLVGAVASSYQRRSLFVHHLLMGSILGCMMVLTFLRAKKAQNTNIRELYSSREHYRMIFDNSPVGLVHFDALGLITHCNEKFLQIMGSSREKIIGFNMRTQIVDFAVKTAFAAALQGKTGYYEGDYIAVTSGKSFSLKVIYHGITSKTGELLGGVAIYEDMSEKKRIEKEMARLDRLNLIGQMSASIGHEIRNPMTTVRGFLQLLGNQETDAQKSDYYKIMIDELDRANSIITEFLNLAQNKLVKLELADINDIIDVLYPLISIDALKQDKEIYFLRGAVPRIPLDEKEIRQLILNLVRNGLEAMPKGKRLIIKTFTKGDNLVLSVKDEGSGISPEVAERLGIPFFTTKETGTGLGLAVCYSIVNRHNATIDIDTGSTGTTFFVRFKIPKPHFEKKKVS